MFIPLMAILAAVALPMYSTFKQKGKTATSIKAVGDTLPTLMEWYNEEGSFTGITVAPEGGPLTVGDRSVGISLAQAPGAAWSIDGEGDIITFRFNFDETSGCPPEVCDGMYMVNCTENPCKTIIKVGTNNQLGLDKD